MRRGRPRNDESATITLSREVRETARLIRNLRTTISGEIDKAQEELTRSTDMSLERRLALVETLATIAQTAAKLLESAAKFLQARGGDGEGADDVEMVEKAILGRK